MTKILVVEDEAPIRERVVKALTYEGYVTLEGENGRAGLELAKTEHPDLIIADIMMPVVFALPENATVAKASSLMVFEGVHRIPVVSSDGQVVGILSSLDILGWLASTPVGSSAAPGAGRNAHDTQDPFTSERSDCDKDGGPHHGM